MLKKYFAIFLIVGLSISFLEIKSYAADNAALMECLMRKDKTKIIDCLQRDFPDFYRGSGGYYCHALPEEMRKECEKTKAKWFDELFGIWQVLYGQCQKGMSVADCIAKMDIRRCKEVGKEEDDGVIGGFGKGTCYALAAFLKSNATICQNQFYPGTGMNCNAWLKDLSLDCLNCGQETLIPDKGKEYFNCLYDDGTTGMEDISYCKGMSDLQKSDDCFQHAAVVLEDPVLCEQLSTTKRSDNCYLLCSVKMKRRDFCDKILDSQARELCRN
jgi:hypothetical protein